MPSPAKMLGDGAHEGIEPFVTRQRDFVLNTRASISSGTITIEIIEKACEMKAKRTTRLKVRADRLCQRSMSAALGLWHCNHPPGSES